MKWTLIILGSIALSACAALIPGNQETESILGIWLENSTNRSSVTIRSKNGRYKSRVIQRYALGQSPLFYECSGKWSQRGRKYSFSIESISAELWKSSVGKTYVLEVRNIRNDLFEYISSDGAIVTETKVGQESETAFRNTPVPPLK